MKQKILRRISIIKDIFTGNVEIVNGLNLFLPAGLFPNIRERFIFWYQIVFKDQYHAREFIRPEPASKSIVIDAGANIGVFTRFAASLGADVYAFEPFPASFDKTRSSTNAFLNVHVYNAALGEKAGTQNLCITKFGSGSNFIDGMSEGNFVSMIPVLVTTIDDFVSEHGLQKVSFIKMDTEGSEKKILEGAKETIKKFKPVIVMSAYHHKEDIVSLPETLRAIRPDYTISLSRQCELEFICT
jgi:FkbM family methyltransferase